MFKTLEAKEQVRVHKQFGNNAPPGKWDKVRFSKENTEILTWSGEEHPPPE